MADAFLYFDGGSIEFVSAPQAETIIKNTAITNFDVTGSEPWPFAKRKLSFRGCQMLLEKIQSKTIHIQNKTIPARQTEEGLIAIFPFR